GAVTPAAAANRAPHRPRSRERSTAWRRRDMTTSTRVISLVTLLAVGIGAGVAGDHWWRAHTAAGAAGAERGTQSPQPPDEDEESEPAAVVRTVIARAGDLPRVVDALGSAAIPPTATVIEAWPSDVLVTRVLVQPGDTVSKDTPILQVAPTRDSETQ